MYDLFVSQAVNNLGQVYGCHELPNYPQLQAKQRQGEVPPKPEEHH